jgi:hypothetical protein
MDRKLALRSITIWQHEHETVLATLGVPAGLANARLAEQIRSLGENVEFKGKAKAFCRTYSFLSSLIPYSNTEWEKLSIMLNLLTPKLPAPKEEDLSKGILEAIDMDSYRVEKKAVMKIALEDKDAEIEPAPTDEKRLWRSRTRSSKPCCEDARVSRWERLL